MQREHRASPHRARRAVGVAAIVVAVLLPAAVVAAEEGPAPAPAAGAGALAGSDLIPVYEGDDDGTTSFVPPVATATDRALPKLSDIQVTYRGFSSSSRAAFEYAVNIWERMVRSSVPIRIDATWTPLPTGQLGAAGSNGTVRDFPGAPRSSTYYPLALADARAGRDLYPGRADIIAQLSSSVNWNYGTNGQTGGRMDLASVALHEIGHGLGFTSSFRVVSGIGSYGVDGSRPTAWDRFLTDSSGATLLSRNDSNTLAVRLQSNSARFSGAQAVAANGGAVRIYSPNPFAAGSSMSHFDESAFPRTDADSLMTPFLDWGEAIHDPGNTAIGALRDIGWQTTSSRYAAPTGATVSRIAAGPGRVELNWTKPTSPDRGLISEYQVLQYTNGSTTPSGTYAAHSTQGAMSIGGLTNGTKYQFRIRARNLAGWGEPGPLSPAAIPLALGPFASVDAFLLRQYADILYRGPSAATLASRRNAVNTGVDTPGETVVALMGDATHTGTVNPTIRLYLAYFKRLPDPGGLAYWAGKARSGTSLHRASEQFARSSEFTRAYGSLGNGAFVDLVYQNVLGRAPDAGGRTYWIRKLNGGFPRGSMMINVSESSENIRKTTNTVAVVGLQHALLRRVPSTTELDAAVARLVAGTRLHVLADEIILSPTYAQRITG